LWEEIRSSDLFWNALNMRKALLIGSQFAQVQGDSKTASKYNAAALAINATIYKNHYNG